MHLDTMPLGQNAAKGKSYRSVITDVDDDGDNDIVAWVGRLFLNQGQCQYAVPMASGHQYHQKQVVGLGFRQ